MKLTTFFNKIFHSKTHTAEPNIKKVYYDLPPIANNLKSDKFELSSSDLTPPLNGLKAKSSKDIKKGLDAYNSTSDFPPVRHM